jgi:polysaccharide export outer membrane protein
VAAGKTPAELQAVLTDKVKGLVKYDPIVTVAVPDIMNNKAYIFGGGVAPGAFDLKQRTTLLQLLCAINDIRSADLRNAYVLRGGKKIKGDFYKLLIQGDTTEDIAIEANDAVFVPPFAERSIYVLGAVMAPKYIPYRDGMTVMEAILEAGGFTKFASENQTVIVRREGDKQVVIPVKAKDLIRGGNISQNTPLQVGDYVIAHEGMF